LLRSLPTYRPNLGLVPAGRRRVTPIAAQVLAMVPRPTDNVITVKSSGADAVKDTVPLMIDKINRTAWQVEKLAAYLQGKSREETVRNNWNFIFDHIQYVKDPDGEEQVRSPRRLIYDGKGDCDCFSVCLGALLKQQNIPFKIRVAAYGKSKDFSHVYIVAPKSGNTIGDRNTYYVVDPVVHKFNYEAGVDDTTRDALTNKKDFSMKLTSLDGFGGSALGACTPEKQKTPADIRRFVPTVEIENKGLIITEKFLTLNKITYQNSLNNNHGVISTTDANGNALQLPTIMTKAQAAQALNVITNKDAAAPAPTPNTVPAAQAEALSLKSLWEKAKENPWVLLGLGALGYAVLSSKE
jgi:hypothetical protein